MNVQKAERTNERHFAGQRVIYVIFAGELQLVPAQSQGSHIKVSIHLRKVTMRDVQCYIEQCAVPIFEHRARRGIDPGKT